MKNPLTRQLTLLLFALVFFFAGCALTVMVMIYSMQVTATSPTTAQIEILGNVYEYQN